MFDAPITIKRPLPLASTGVSPSAPHWTARGSAQNHPPSPPPPGLAHAGPRWLSTPPGPARMPPPWPGQWYNYKNPNLPGREIEPTNQYHTTHWELSEWGQYTWKNVSEHALKLKQPSSIAGNRSSAFFVFPGHKIIISLSYLMEKTVVNRVQCMNVLLGSVKPCPCFCPYLVMSIFMFLQHEHENEHGHRHVCFHVHLTWTWTRTMVESGVGQGEGQGKGPGQWFGHKHGHGCGHGHQIKSNQIYLFRKSNIMRIIFCLGGYILYLDAET